MASVGKKALFKAVKAATPRGEKFGLAAKTLAKYGINKYSTGKIHASEAVKITKALKEEHTFNPHIGEKKKAVSGETAKEILNELVGPKSQDKGPSISEERKQHLAEKKAFLSEHGVKASTDVIQNRTAKVYIVERQKEQEKEEADAMAKSAKKEGGENKPTPAGRRAAAETLRQAVMVPQKPEPEDMFASVPEALPVEKEEKEAAVVEPPHAEVKTEPTPEPPSASEAIDPFGS